MTIVLTDEVKKFIREEIKKQLSPKKAVLAELENFDKFLTKSKKDFKSILKDLESSTKKISLSTKKITSFNLLKKSKRDLDPALKEIEKLSIKLAKQKEIASLNSKKVEDRLKLVYSIIKKVLPREGK
jgi:hypothetical protein